MSLSSIACLAIETALSITSSTVYPNLLTFNSLHPKVFVVNTLLPASKYFLCIFNNLWGFFIPNISGLSPIGRPSF